MSRFTAKQDCKKLFAFIWTFKEFSLLSTIFSIAGGIKVSGTNFTHLSSSLFKLENFEIQKTPFYKTADMKLAKNTSAALPFE